MECVCCDGGTRFQNVHKFLQTIIVWGIKIKIKRILKEHANFLLCHIMFKEKGVFYLLFLVLEVEMKWEYKTEI